MNITAGLFEKSGLHRTQAQLNYPCTHYIFFIKNADSGKLDVVIKDKSHQEKQWYYIANSDCKIKHSNQGSDKAYLTVEYDQSKAQRVKIDRLNNNRYLVSENGLVIDRKYSRTKPLNVGSNGYYFISANTGEGNETVNQHRMVAHAFCAKPDRHADKDYSELEVNHKDGVKTNNHYSNLEWVTGLENTQHALENNLSNSGRLYTKDKVKQIRDDFVKQDYNTYTITEHADKYGCDKTTMRLILLNLSYPDPEYVVDVSRFGSRSGQASHNASLSAQIVKDIRDDYRANKKPYSEYSRLYDTSIGIIRNVILNLTYEDKDYIPPIEEKVNISEELEQEIRKDNHMLQKPYGYYADLYDISLYMVRKILYDIKNDGFDIEDKRSELKLNQTSAAWIREDHKLHKRPLKYYSDMFGCTQGNITNVLLNKIWPDENYVSDGPMNEKKLTVEDVRWIRDHYAVTKSDGAYYALKFGVHKSVIYNVLKNLAWYDPSYVGVELDHGSSKLTHEQVKEMRAHFMAAPETSFSYYANLYNISATAAGDILKNKSYKDDSYIPPQKSKIKVTDEDVKWIREDYAVNKRPHLFYAEKFNIDKTSVSEYINNRKRYDPNYTPPARK